MLAWLIGWRHKTNRWLKFWHQGNGGKNSHISFSFPLFLAWFSIASLRELFAEHTWNTSTTGCGFILTACENNSFCILFFSIVFFFFLSQAQALSDFGDIRKFFYIWDANLNEICFRWSQTKWLVVYECCVNFDGQRRLHKSVSTCSLLL